MNLIDYIKSLFKSQWIHLKVPKEYKSKKNRLECLKQTRQQIIKHSKIIK